MSTDISNVTLEEHLIESIFGETGNLRLPTELEILRRLGIASSLANVETSERNRYLENFAISYIPISIEETELVEHIQDYYKSHGYESFKGPMKICFRKERQKVGINLSYNQDYQICLISVLDFS